jgi:hypothetical protein
VWTIDTIDATENKTGMLEFHSEADDPSQYFPLAVDFVSAESLCEVSVSRCLMFTQSGVALQGADVGVLVAYARSHLLLSSHPERRLSSPRRPSST